MPSRREFLTALASTASGAVLANIFGCSHRKLKPAQLLAPRTLEDPPPGVSFFRTAGMIGRVTGAGAVLNLVTSGNLAEHVLARVRWAGAIDALPSSPHVSPAIAAAESLSRLELPLANLEPNGDYVCRVECARASSPGEWFAASEPGRFRSQKTAGRSFRFCVVADPHWGDARNVLPAGPRWQTGEQCLRQIVEDGPFDFMIDLGDSPQPIGTESAGDAVECYLRYRDVMAPITREMPVYLVLGNHEKEAGFHQRGTDDSNPPQPSNCQSATQYHQMWSAEARLLCIPNPRGDTYLEGGEGAPGYDSRDHWLGPAGPWNEGATRSHLQNFYAWTWGDALLVVLDPFRYTLVGSLTRPNRLSQWTLGATQLQWLQDVLARSNATWKFVLAHHQVGGGLIDRRGRRVVEDAAEAAYGRGSAVEADRLGVEQAIIHGLMRQHGVQFFLYGHDHAFCHSMADGVNYICCGRPTHLSRWWSGKGMLDSYGSILSQPPDAPWVERLHNVLGYTQFEVTPGRVTMRWIRTGYSYRDGEIPIERAKRDWRECWLGRQYPVDSPSRVTVTMPPRRVDGVRTLRGARISDFYQRPFGKDYQRAASGASAESDSPLVVPLDDFPERVAVVDTVPELVYEVGFDL